MATLSQMQAPNGSLLSHAAGPEETVLACELRSRVYLMSRCPGSASPCASLPFDHFARTWKCRLACKRWRRDWSVSAAMCLAGSAWARRRAGLPEPLPSAIPLLGLSFPQRRSPLLERPVLAQALGSHARLPD